VTEGASLAPQGTPLTGIKALVVEDEPNIRRSLLELLPELGCRVIGPAGSVVGAIKLVQRERPDVALLDLTLRDGSAMPVAEMLGRLGVPFALTTGGARVPLGDPALHGALCLAKPYGLGELELVLRRLAELARGRLASRLAAGSPLGDVGRQVGQPADDSGRAAMA
jgi:CheY-like chemotaxis protein